MNHLISALESRTLFSVSSVTTAQLRADRQAIANSAAALNSTLALYFSENTSFTKQIGSDFTVVPKSEKFLLNQLIGAENKSKAMFHVDVAQLNAKEQATAAASVAAGSSLIVHPSLRGATSLGNVIVKLDASYTAPLAKLTAQIASTTVDGVRNAIIAELASDTALVSAVQAQQTEVNQNKAAIAAAAQTLVNAVNTLATDLSTVKTDISTFPSLLGTLTGNLTVSSGKLGGESIPVTLDVLTEDPTTGKFSGSLAGVDPSGSDPVTGSVTLAGNTSLKAVTITDGTFTLTGTFDSPSFSGKFTSPVGRGVFVLTI